MNYSNTRAILVSLNQNLCEGQEIVISEDAELCDLHTVKEIGLKHVIIDSYDTLLIKFEDLAVIMVTEYCDIILDYKTVQTIETVRTINL
jgi:hypothetical protein